MTPPYDEYTDEELMEMAGIGSPPINESDYSDEELMAMIPRSPTPKRGLGAAWEEVTTPVYAEGGMTDTLPKIGEKILRTAGHLGESVGDWMVGAAKTAYKYAVPPAYQVALESSLANIAETDIAKSQMKTLRGAKEAASVFEKEFPRASKNIEAGINALNLVPAYQVGKAGVDVAGAVARETGEALIPLSERLYASSIKAPISKKWTEVLPGKEMSTRKSVVKAGLEDTVPPSEYGIAKVTNLEKEARSLVDEIVGEGASKGDIVYTEDILSKGLERAYKKAENASDPVGAKKIIDDIAEKFRAHGETIPSDKLNAIKRDLYDEVKWGGAEQTAMVSKFTAMGKKGIAHEAMVQLEEFYPEIKALNKKDAAYINLKEAIERASAKLDNSDYVGLGAKVLFTRSIPTAIFEWTIGHPAVKSRLAFALNKAGRALGGGKPVSKSLPAITPSVVPESPMDMSGITGDIAEPLSTRVGVVPEVAGQAYRGNIAPRLMSTDARLAQAEADAMASRVGQMNIPERPFERTALEKALDAPDEYMATGGGFVGEGGGMQDTVLRISPEELNRMRLEDILESGGAGLGSPMTARKARKLFRNIR